MTAEAQEDDVSRLPIPDSGSSSTFVVTCEDPLPGLPPGTTATSTLPMEVAGSETPPCRKRRFKGYRDISIVDEAFYQKTP
jgi:hypothetical protein